MLVHLAMTLSTVRGWHIPSDDKASPFSSHESAITGGVDGARARRQLASGCTGSWSVYPPAPVLSCLQPCDAWPLFCSQ